MERWSSRRMSGTISENPSSAKRNWNRGVNFTNVIRAVFTRVNLKSVKNTVRSAHVKVLRKMLMKLNRGVDFINIKKTAVGAKVLNVAGFALFFFLLVNFGLLSPFIFTITFCQKEIGEQLKIKCWWNWLQFTRLSPILSRDEILVSSSCSFTSSTNSYDLVLNSAMLE